MTPIKSKVPTDRAATATATISFSNPSTYFSLRDANLKKGDALAVARVAGIMAVKRTADLIPLAHPGLGITGVEVDIELIAPPSSAERDMDSPKSESPHHSPNHNHSSTEPNDVADTRQIPSHRPLLQNEHGGVVITTHVSCHARTGVEMEALTAATVAGLAVYDMCKARDRGMVMHDIRVLRKEGGRSGSWWFDPDADGGRGKVTKDRDIRSETTRTATMTTSGGMNAELLGHCMSRGYSGGASEVGTGTGGIDEYSSVATSAAPALGPSPPELFDDPDRDLLGGGWSWLQQSDRQHTGKTFRG